MLKEDHPVFGRIRAIAVRMFLFHKLFQRLRNLELHAAQEVHNETLATLRKDWRSGAPHPATVLTAARNLLDLAPLVEPDRLLGQAVAANVFYLFGYLERV